MSECDLAIWTIVSQGLNPHQNRTVPPLRYEWVYALKRDFPHLDFSLNGGVQSAADAAAAIAYSPDWSAPDGPGPAAEAAGDDHAMAEASTCSGHAATAADGGSSSNGHAAGEAAAVGNGASCSGAAPPRIYGVMIGRAAYNDPWGCLADADRAVFGADSNPAISRRQARTADSCACVAFSAALTVEQLLLGCVCVSVCTFSHTGDC